MISKSIHKHHAISEQELYQTYRIFFGTLVSASRLKMLNLLRKKAYNVSEIMRELNMDQTAVSHDLARLKRCGFVRVETQGKYRYYALNEKTIKPLLELIDKHMNTYCVHILHHLQEKGGKHQYAESKNRN